MNVAPPYNGKFEFFYEAQRAYGKEIFPRFKLFILIFSQYFCPSLKLARSLGRGAGIRNMLIL